jgi:hypothetical protein
MDTNEPKKYIRTFIGDMETLKKGGVPELVPFVESKSLPPKPSPLQTYASDFSDKVKETHSSPITVLAAEQDAAPMEKPQTEQKSRSGISYIIAGLVLMVISGLTVYFAYAFYSSGSAPVIVEPTVLVPIFVDEREQISGTSIALLQAIKQSINKPLAQGAVRLLYTADTASTSDSVFAALQLPAPSVLLRNINAKDSMAGIVNAGDVQSPFFILSVTSYSNTFSGMLSWEPAMPNDLSQLFPSYAVASTVSTSSPQATATSTIASWRDETVSNHDVRIYRDAANQSILLYGYWNQATLIITRDPAAFAEILQRLATSRAPQ